MGGRAVQAVALILTACRETGPTSLDSLWRQPGAISVAVTMTGRASARVALSLYDRASDQFYDRALDLAPSGSASFSSLHAGTYDVGLDARSAGCTARPEAPDPVVVSPGTTTPVAFVVTCMATAERPSSARAAASTLTRFRLARR